MSTTGEPASGSEPKTLWERGATDVEKAVWAVLPVLAVAGFVLLQVSGARYLTAWTAGLWPFYLASILSIPPKNR